MDLEEYEIENKRLSQKNAILQDEIAILNQELNIMKKSNHSGSIQQSDWEEEAKKVKELLIRKDALLSKFAQNLVMLQGRLGIEKLVYKEVKFFISQFQLQISKYKEQILESIEEERTKSSLKIKDITNKLSTQIDVLKSRSQILETENSELILKCLDLRKENEMGKIAMNEKISELQNQMNKAEEAVISDRSIFKLKMDEIAQEMNSWKKKYQIVAEDNTIKSIVIEKLEKECNQLRGSNFSSDSDLKRLKEEVAVKNMKITENSQEISRLQSIIKEKEFQMQIQVDQLDQIKRTCGEKDSQNLELKSKFDRLLQTYESVQSDVKALLSREGSLRAECNQKDNDNQKLEQQIITLQQQRQQLEDSFHEEREVLKKKFDAELADVRNQFLHGKSQDTVEREDLKAQLATVIKEKRDVEDLLSKERTLTQKRQAENNQHITALETTLKEKKKEIERFAQENEKRDVELSRLTKENQSLQELVNSHRKEITSHQHLLRSLQAQLDAQTSQDSNSKNLEERIQQLEKENSSLQYESKQKNNEIQSLKDTIRRECEERTHFLIKISDLEDEIRRLKVSRSSNAASQTPSNTSKSFSSGELNPNSAGTSTTSTTSTTSASSRSMPVTSQSSKGGFRSMTKKDPMVTTTNNSRLHQGEYVDTDVQPFLKSIIQADNSLETGKLNMIGNSGNGGNDGNGSHVSSQDSRENEDWSLNVAWSNRLKPSRNKNIHKR